MPLARQVGVSFGGHCFHSHHRHDYGRQRHLHLHRGPCSLLISSYAFPPTTANISTTANTGCPSGYCDFGQVGSWCQGVDENIGTTDSVDACWETCYTKYSSELIAIDWDDDDGDCYCQNSCDSCGGTDNHLAVVRGFGSLPSACGGGTLTCDEGAKWYFRVPYPGTPTCSIIPPSLARNTTL